MGVLVEAVEEEDQAESDCGGEDSERGEEGGHYGRAKGVAMQGIRRGGTVSGIALLRLNSCETFCVSLPSLHGIETAEVCNGCEVLDHTLVT